MNRRVLQEGMLLTSMNVENCIVVCVAFGQLQFTYPPTSCRVQTLTNPRDQFLKEMPMKVGEMTLRFSMAIPMLLAALAHARTSGLRS